MPQTQMNIRIDERLKVRGDAAFESIGWTPSQAARALWRFAATHEGDRRILKDECEKLAGRGGQGDAAARALVEESWAIVDGGLADCGLDLQLIEPTGSYDDLRERVLYERLSERSLL